MTPLTKGLAVGHGESNPCAVGRLWQMPLADAVAQQRKTDVHCLEKMWLPASEILAFYVVLSTFAKSFIDRKQ